VRQPLGKGRKRVTREHDGCVGGLCFGLCAFDSGNSGSWVRLEQEQRAGARDNARRVGQLRRRQHAHLSDTNHGVRQGRERACIWHQRENLVALPGGVQIKIFFK
jgi:hypothetical protein